MNSHTLAGLDMARIVAFEETVMNHSMKWDNDKINEATAEAIAKLDEIIEGGVA